MNLLSYLIAAAGIAIGVTFSYLVIVPLERRDARAGYVQEDRALAAEAKSAELQRQVEAGNIVISSYQEIRKNALAKEAADDAKLEQGRLEFEAKLKAAGRSCGITADDLDWVQH
jgi:hypothetical protein